ncbi:MAG: flagellar hook-length control protein FliK, partial [Gammaproteobacteria bacterium]|nr:flagellar hook-length control protein FliK [Gammaproteobacteria bacterium]
NVNQTVVNNQASVSTQKMKFEIPVILPDKERFPLLADKLVAAFSQIQTGNNNSGKSISKLFSQLSRLHQWISDNKTAGRTESGAQASKSANDLKESLKDLFRYINHKDTLKTGSSIEKALKQSGTFLEKRIAIQKEVSIYKQSKPPTELTLHKDIKANLNRVLATALYNLAKINTHQLKSPQIPQPSQSTTTSAGTSSSSANSSSAQKALTGSSSSLNSNLLNNIKTKLRQFTAGRTVVGNLPELERITKEVLTNVQDALSRTQLGQLTNLRPESSTQQWLFELPVMNGKNVDSFSIYLNEEDESTDENGNMQRRWSVVLQFEIGELGKIRSMLSWENNKIQVRFLAEQQNTVNLVGTELEYFQKMLNKQDIIFEQLTIEQAQLGDLNVQFSGRTS